MSVWELSWLLIEVGGSTRDVGSTMSWAGTCAVREWRKLAECESSEQAARAHASLSALDCGWDVTSTGVPALISLAWCGLGLLANQVLTSSKLVLVRIYVYIHSNRNETRAITHPTFCTGDGNKVGFRVEHGCQQKLRPKEILCLFLIG